MKNVNIIIHQEHKTKCYRQCEKILSKSARINIESNIFDITFGRIYFNVRSIVWDKATVATK
jgi:hypothetical protein